MQRLNEPVSTFPHHSSESHCRCHGHEGAYLWPRRHLLADRRSCTMHHWHPCVSAPRGTAHTCTRHSASARLLHRLKACSACIPAPSRCAPHALADEAFHDWSPSPGMNANVLAKHQSESFAVEGSMHADCSCIYRALSSSPCTAVLGWGAGAGR